MKIFRYILILLSTCIITISGQSIRDSLSEFSLDSVVVSAARSSILLNESPFSISVIDRETINNNINPLSLANILVAQSGIILNNRFNPSQGDRIQIRGIGTRAQFGVKGIRLMLDGIPLTFPDGQSQLNNIDISTIESIEILKGPSSVLYGNSLGGIILLKSKQVNTNKYYAKPELMFGSYGLRKLGVFSSANFEKVNVTLSGYHLKYEGFRNHSESEYYGINFTSMMHISKDITLSLLGNYYNAPYLLNPSSLNKFDAVTNPKTVRASVYNFGTGKKLDQIQAGINLNIKMSDNSEITATLYNIGRSLLNSIPGRVIDLERNVKGIRIELENKIQLADFNVSVLTGLDYELQNDTRKEFENEGVVSPNNISPSTLFDRINYSEILLNQDEDVNNVGVFTNLHFNPFDRITLSAGLRYDNYYFEVNDKLFDASKKISMNNLSSMIGFSTNLYAGFTFYGNYSNGFQTPTTNELSNNPYGPSGFNDNLKPEKIYNYEIGVKYWIDKLSLLFTGSLFKMNITNMLIPYQSQTEETYYRNAGKAENYGLEAQFRFFTSKTTSISANYSYINFKFDDYIVESEMNNQTERIQLEGNYLPGIPKNKVSLSFNFKVIEKLQANILLSWTDKQFTNDYNGPAPGEDADIKNFINDSHTKINLNAAYKVSVGQVKLNFKLGIENLLDERYNDSIVPNAFGNNFFEPAADRSYFISISSEF